MPLHLLLARCRLPALAVLLWSSTTLAATTQPSAARVTEAPLYRIPDNTKVGDTTCSADARHVGCVETRDGKYWIAIDDVRSPAMDWVVGKSLAFSPDGGRFSFLTQKGDAMAVVVGTVGPKWDAAEQPGGYQVGRALFSPDGKRFAYGMQAERGGKMAMVVDGKPQTPVDEILAADAQFSPDGKRFAYHARGDKGRMYVVDGVPQPPYETIFGLTFSPDGGRCGYFAKVGAEMFAVVDGKPGKRYAGVGGLMFSPDGKRYAYVAQATAADAKPADAGTQPVARQQLVYNGGQGEQAFAPVERIGAIAFSPAGGRLAITTLADKKWTVTLDGKPARTFDATGGLLFSPDGKRLAVVVGKDGQQFVDVDGKAYPPVDAVGPMQFSPDGTRLAFMAAAGRQRWLYLEDQRLGAATFMAFTPDSKHLGHALPDGEGWQMAVDGTPTPAKYDGFPPGSNLVWDGPKAGRVIAAREKVMYAVKVELP